MLLLAKILTKLFVTPKHGFSVCQIPQNFKRSYKRHTDDHLRHLAAASDPILNNKQTPMQSVTASILGAPGTEGRCFGNQVAVLRFTATFKISMDCIQG